MMSKVMTKKKDDYRPASENSDDDGPVAKMVKHMSADFTQKS